MMTVEDRPGSTTPSGSPVAPHRRDDPPRARNRGRGRATTRPRPLKHPDPYRRPGASSPLGEGDSPKNRPPNTFPRSPVRKAPSPRTQGPPPATAALRAGVSVTGPGKRSPRRPGPNPSRSPRARRSDRGEAPKGGAVEKDGLRPCDSGEISAYGR